MKQMYAKIRVITPEQTEEATHKCKIFFDAMCATLIANGEPMKVIPDFPAPKASHIAYSKIDSSQDPEKEEFPPIRIKISAQGTHLSLYLDFYPAEGAGAKRLLLEILLQIFPDSHGLSFEFYDPITISPEIVAALMLTRVRMMRAIYEKYRKNFERIYQKELDFTAELYAEEAEKIIQDL